MRRTITLQLGSQLDNWNLDQAEQCLPRSPLREPIGPERQSRCARFTRSTCSTASCGCSAKGTIRRDEMVAWYRQLLDRLVPPARRRGGAGMTMTTPAPNSNVSSPRAPRDAPTGVGDPRIDQPRPRATPAFTRTRGCSPAGLPRCGRGMRRRQRRSASTPKWLPIFAAPAAGAASDQQELVDAVASPLACSGAAGESAHRLLSREHCGCDRRAMPRQRAAAMTVRRRAESERFPVAMVCHFNHSEATEYRDKGELGGDGAIDEMLAFEKTRARIGRSRDLRLALGAARTSRSSASSIRGRARSSGTA